mgnify:CR=1 FL=1
MQVRVGPNRAGPQGFLQPIADALKLMGVTPSVKHAACSAATILFPDTYFDMVRLGIAAYGMWSSKETLVSARQLQRENIELKPVITWKTRISQIKNLNS